MPQMMPLNWPLLFMMFIFTLLTFTSMNYFNFNQINKIFMNKSKLYNPHSNWKW
uniref:ATP synthase F0 subunit 8 n=1 Tax=Eucorydia linglong TaxID=3037041 RepID=UPI0027AA8488|nr:ATP synthase F0 subunit 8 [Eucorydia linglong]WGO57811.1 ATP synthase F0 subunit 8 [Eucorydia linglong]